MVIELAAAIGRLLLYAAAAGSLAFFLTRSERVMQVLTVLLPAPSDTHRGDHR